MKTEKGYKSVVIDGITVRKMVKEDIEGVRNLDSELFPLRHFDYKKGINNPDTRCFVAITEENIVIGMAAYHLYGKVANILTIGVIHKYQHKGIGKALLSYIIESIKNEADSVLLQVRDSNLLAKLFYGNQGFINVQIKPRYYEGKEDALIMGMRLNTVAN